MPSIVSCSNYFTIPICHNLVTSRGNFAKLDQCRWCGILPLLVLQLGLASEIVSQSFIRCNLSLEKLDIISLYRQRFSRWTRFQAWTFLSPNGRIMHPLGNMNVHVWATHYFFSTRPRPLVVQAHSALSEHCVPPESSSQRRLTVPTQPWRALL